VCVCCVGETPDAAFNQTITYGCLYKLFIWAKSKQKSLKSDKTQFGPTLSKSSVHGADDSTKPDISSKPRDLTGIVHSVIRYIAEFGSCSSSATSQRQLKTQLPPYKNLNRSVTTALAPSNLKCCLPAECIYVSSNAQTPCRTPEQRKRDSRKQSEQCQLEQSANTAHHRARRSDVEFREQEQARNTGCRKARRCDSEVRRREQTQNTGRKKARRCDSEVRHREQTQDTGRRKACRCDSEVRHREQTQDTGRRKACRCDSEFRRQEQTQDTRRRKTRRRDSEITAQEQIQNTALRKAHRCDYEVRRQEQSVGTQRRRTHRQNLDVRAQEQLRKIARNSAANVSEQIVAFHDVISIGPLYICSSCDQFLYRHSVQKAASVRSLNQPIITLVLLSKTSFDGVEYICSTCTRYLRKNQIPHVPLQTACISLKYPLICHY